MTPLTDTLNGPQWLEVLEQLAAALSREGSAVQLCLIGSSACLFGGMEARTSRDLDVWRPLSDYDRMELKQAAEAVGLLFDPKTVLDPDRPYLQIVERGVVEIGEFQPVLIERMGRLHLTRPPIENLIASKLIRGDARDIADILFLRNLHHPDLERIKSLIASFSPEHRHQAEENFIYLELTTP
ncbi:MAG: DUF6036 family nucleotidyltransferase [Verrucomicrobiales bacterium]